MVFTTFKVACFSGTHKDRFENKKWGHRSCVDWFEPPHAPPSFVLSSLGACGLVD